MEFLEGETLAERLLRGRIPLPDVLRYGAQIAAALDKAHRHGVVHRDVKPGNIMLTKSGVKLLDFGLAKSGVISPGADATTEQRPLTTEGAIVGPFQYMAPEQIEGGNADARSDLFALGAVLYEMLTGRRAFEGKSKPSLIAAIMSGEPKPLSDLQPLTPPGLAHVVKKCLAKDPEDRWQSASDVADELRWISESDPGTPPPMVRHGRTRERIAWAIAVVGAAVIATLVARSATRTRTPSTMMRFAIPLPPVAA